MKTYNLKTTIGIPRDQLPQIEDEYFDSIMDHLKGRYEECTRKCLSLKPSQDELNLDKIQGMIKEGNHLKPRIIFISKDDYIVDGHHVWAARIVDDMESEIDCIQIDKNIIDLINWFNTQKFTYSKKISEGKKHDKKTY